MFVPVIVMLVVFSFLLILISLKMKRFDAEAQMEDLDIRHAAEMYGMKKRLRVLEEEILMGLEE